MVDWNYPKTVDEAVDRLVSALSLKDRVYIASLSQDELYLIHISLRAYVGQELGLWTGNRDLIESCRRVNHSNTLSPEQCLGLVLERLWRRLRETHTLRAVEKGDKG